MKGLNNELMKRISRYSFSDVTVDRLISASRTRLLEIPHSLSWMFDPSSAMNKVKIQQFKDIHKGKRCFIVANGPSLSKTNLDLLQNEYTFGLNRIYLHFQKSTFRPTYYLAVNELVLEQFSNEILKLEMPKFLNWNRRSYYGINKPDICYIKSKMVFYDHFECDLTKPTVVGGTVTFVALQLAYYMGFEEVILVGLDHNYVEKGTPSKTEVRQENIDMSHFHPDYFPKGLKWQLPDLLRSEIDYKIALNQYQQTGRRILDATIGGKCQVFSKVDYLSLFPS